MVVGAGSATCKAPRRVLYRLDELQGENRVSIPEREKDADRLWQEGIPATTCPGGAGKWRDEYANQLWKAGATNVLVIPDNDGPGRRHAQDIAKSCHAKGLSVRVVTLPGVPEKGDVSDFLTNHPARALEELACAAPAFTTDTNEPTLDGADATPFGPRLVSMADVEPQEVKWLWDGRLARGKQTLLIGDPGVGKSWVTLDLAARLSRGGSMPRGTGTAQGDVIFLTAEDGLADTVRPRLDRLRADVTRITCLTAMRDEDGDRPFSLVRDLPGLEHAITERSATMVIIDPLSAYLDGSDSYKDAAIRQVLSPLKDLAERTSVAIISIMHLTKASDRKAIHRALGSVALTAAARIVVGVGKHPDDPDIRVVVPVKCNIGPLPDTLAFQLRDDCLEWEPEPVTGMTADDVLNAHGRHADDRNGAQEFLAELLADGPVQSTQVLKDGEANRFSRSTMFRAKSRLGVKAVKKGGSRGGVVLAVPKWADSPARR